MRLQDRVAIVTGGAQGIGRAYSLGLAREGCAVVVADLVAGDAVVAEIEEAGGRAAAIRVDVSDEESTNAMAATAVDRFGRIDALINNAGYFKHVFRGPFDEIDVDEWDKAFAVNVRGVWLCCKAVMPQMQNQGYGKIINISSNTVWKGAPNFLHYVTSKAALTGLTRALAREVGDHNISVNTVAPDFIPDEHLHKLHPGRDEEIAAARAFKRGEVPEDMVGTIIFLVSAGSDFITGQSILVNGGAHFQ